MCLQNECGRLINEAVNVTNKITPRPSYMIATIVIVSPEVIL